VERTKRKNKKGIKKMNIKFILPVMIEKIADKCIASYDLDPHNLMIVDNSKRGFCKKYIEKGFDVYSHPENLGVPASWNIGMKSDADFLFIVSESLIFNKGFSELIEKLQFANEWGLLTNQAWHCIGFTRKTIEKVGLFDEQFYPAYFEDTDYCYRLKINHIHNEGNNNMPKVEIDVTCQGTALVLKSGLVSVKFDRLIEYYKHKWGGLPDQEKFLTPFNQG
jgi:hypothetical protein